MIKTLYFNIKAQSKQLAIEKIISVMSLLWLIFSLCRISYWHFTGNFWLIHPQSPFANWITSDYFLSSLILSLSPLLLWVINPLKISQPRRNFIHLTLFILVILNQISAGFIGFSVPFLICVWWLTYCLLKSNLETLNT